jgi:hypothetical protein
VFGIWSVFVGGMAALFAWEAVTRGGWYWLPTLWILGIGVAGWLSIALEVSVAPGGELTFRGLLWRRRWNAADLQSIRPGNGCMVFRFASGSVMLASSGGRDWPKVESHLRSLNVHAGADEAELRDRN